MTEADKERNEQTNRYQEAGWRLASAYNDWLRVENRQAGGEVEIYNELCAARQEYAAARKARNPR